ncbi:unnamed protein product, partial [Rotaria sp. Silwood2]
MLNTFNPKYIQFELIFRFIILICSITVTWLFIKSIHQFSILDWSLEQKWTVLLLIFLVFYNDPFYLLIILSDYLFLSILDKILQISFLCILLLFWLSFYHGIRQNVRQFLPFYLPKIILVSILWIFSIVFSSVRIIQEFHDPMYNMTIDITQFTIFHIIFYIVGIFYVLYLLFLIIRAYSELRNMPYFDVRLKFTTVLMICVILISMIIIVLRFGSSIIKENFVPELTTCYNNSMEFLLFYSLINIYLYTMAYVYSPAKNATIESLVRDNSRC